LPSGTNSSVSRPSPSSVADAMRVSGGMSRNAIRRWPLPGARVALSQALSRNQIA
jgi:hypothetical protein